MSPEPNNSESSVNLLEASTKDTNDTSPLPEFKRCSVSESGPSPLVFTPNKSELTEDSLRKLQSKYPKDVRSPRTPGIGNREETFSPCTPPGSPGGSLRVSAFASLAVSELNESVSILKNRRSLLRFVEFPESCREVTIKCETGKCCIRHIPLRLQGVGKALQSK